MTTARSGSCQILDLRLGPLDLNLLGLVVHLDMVHLNITAEPGPGNLLGNLLCAGRICWTATVVKRAQQLVNRLNRSWPGSNGQTDPRRGRVFRAARTPGPLSGE